MGTSTAPPDPLAGFKGREGARQGTGCLDGREDGERGREGMTGPRISKYGYTYMPIGVRRSDVDAVV